jgi:hypothetical protein
MHDTGKIGIPESILRKPAKLDAAEWVVMKQHTQFGYNILRSCPQTWCKRQSGSHGLRSGWIANQTVTADRLTVGLSPTSARVSRVM